MRSSLVIVAIGIALMAGPVNAGQTPAAPKPAPAAGAAGGADAARGRAAGARAGARRVRSRKAPRSPT